MIHVRNLGICIISILVTYLFNYSRLISSSFYLKKENLVNLIALTSKSTFVLLAEFIEIQYTCRVVKNNRLVFFVTGQTKSNMFKSVHVTSVSN